ncbi:MAG: hypothetical protein GU356_05750 [Pyrobaculum sp.]|jgi:hypothetical protein|nr:hypothetical protein [Pyrobaculum sp.]
MDVEELLRKIPRPYGEDIPELYRELDEMTRRIAEILMASNLYNAGTQEVDFGRATSEDLVELISKDPEVMVPFFVMITGFSHRELRQRGLGSVYSLRRVRNREKLRPFANLVRGLLAHPLRLETVLYKFYKNWEEHQRRHWRGRRAENEVCRAVMAHCGNAGKYVFQCGGKRREIDCAVPRDKPVVAINVRVGVGEDRAKRIKEFATELKEVKGCDVKYFVVVYFVPEHERSRLEEIRAEFTREASFDLVVLTREELGSLVEKLREWGVPGCV